MPIAASTAQARNAAWKPSFSTTSGSAPSFAARNCSERVRATVVTMATPSAAPIWRVVLLRPDASPDSLLAMPARAATVAATKVVPRPVP